MNLPQPVRQLVFSGTLFEETLRAVADRIVPSDAQTPGAYEAGALEYLHKQLSPTGDLTYERRAYEDALLQLNDWAKVQHGGTPFSDLSEAEQDDLLRQLQKQSPHFFARMVEHVQEGFYTSQAAFDMIGWTVTG